MTYRQEQDAPNNAVVNGGLEDYQREYTVGSLSRDTFYIFEISAKTSIGWGTPAILKVRTILNRRRLYYTCIGKGDIQLKFFKIL